MFTCALRKHVYCASIVAYSVSVYLIFSFSSLKCFTSKHCSDCTAAVCRNNESETIFVCVDITDIYRYC